MNDNDITKIEKDVIERFKNEPVLNTLPFSVKSYVKCKKDGISTEYDIVIYLNNVPYAVVEIKRSLRNIVFMESAKRAVIVAFNLLDCNYGIITNGIDFYICDSQNTKNFQKLDFHKIVSVLQNNDIQSEIIIFFQSEIESILKKHNMECFVKRFENVGGQFRFKENAETDFWHSMLNNSESFPTKIYRYTTLDTVLFLLNNRTYRMNGIVGMNDCSEIDYFDDYCYPDEKQNPSYQILNNLYLSSCSLLYDDLTMWRLYGDEAKGVCLTFEIKSKEAQDFLLQSVSYAEGKKKHHKLDIVKEIISNHFVLNEIDKWKHFFKAKDYSIEKEIRLLFIDEDKSNDESIVVKKDWLKTNNSSIINPYIDINIDSEKFPLTLTEVMLGPKCPEMATNEEQLKELIRQKGYSIAVETSSIKNYR